MLDAHTALPYKERVMQAVVETEDYLKSVRRIGLTENESQAIITHIAEHPTAGDEIKGTGGARKVRFAAKGKGKSGGVRVVTFYSGTNIPIFLLDVFAKNEKVNLSQAEKNMLKKILGAVADTYRSQRRH
jgi:hypothetical protein